MRHLLFSVTIDDCEVQTFTVGGHGGAGKDTSNTGVRIVHPASGASGEGRESRSQLQNKRTAFARMAKTPSFRNWIRRRKAELETGKTIEQRVDEMMDAKHIKTEGKQDGKWVEIDEN